MTRRSPSRARHAYISTLVVISLALMVVFVSVVVRHAVYDMAAERSAFLEGCADQIVHSARDWSRVHFQELPAADSIRMSVDELLPPGATGSLEFRRLPGEDGAPMVECELTLTRGREEINRTFQWSVTAPLTSE